MNWTVEHSAYPNMRGTWLIKSYHKTADEAEQAMKGYIRNPNLDNNPQHWRVLGPQLATRFPVNAE